MKNNDKKQDELLLRSIKIFLTLEKLFTQVDETGPVLLCTTYGTMYPVVWSPLLLKENFPQEDWIYFNNFYKEQQFSVPIFLEKFGYSIKSKSGISEDTTNSDGEGSYNMVEQHFLKKI